MVDELKVLMADPVLHISLPSCEEVVYHCHLMTVHHQLVSEMGSHKASPTSYLLEKSAECVILHLCKTQNRKTCTCLLMLAKSKHLNSVSANNLIKIIINNTGNYMTMRMTTQSMVCDLLCNTLLSLVFLISAFIHLHSNHIRQQGKNSLQFCQKHDTLCSSCMNKKTTTKTNTY